MSRMKVGDIMKLKKTDGRFLYLITNKRKDVFFGKRVSMFDFMCLNDGEVDLDTETYVNENFIKVA